MRTDDGARRGLRACACESHRFTAHRSVTFMKRITNVHSTVDGTGDFKKLHENNLDMVKCIRRARESVWWPKSIQYIKETVKLKLCNRLSTEKG